MKFFRLIGLIGLIAFSGQAQERLGVSAAFVTNVVLAIGGGGGGGAATNIVGAANIVATAAGGTNTIALTNRPVVTKVTSTNFFGPSTNGGAFMFGFGARTNAFLNIDGSVGVDFPNNIYGNVGYFGIDVNENSRFAFATAPPFAGGGGAGNMTIGHATGSSLYIVGFGLTDFKDLVNTTANTNQFGVLANGDTTNAFNSGVAGTFAVGGAATFRTSVTNLGNEGVGGNLNVSGTITGIGFGITNLNQTNTPFAIIPVSGAMDTVNVMTNWIGKGQYVGQVAINDSAQPTMVWWNSTNRQPMIVLNGFQQGFADHMFFDPNTHTDQRRKEIFMGNTNYLGDTNYLFALAGPQIINYCVQGPGSGTWWSMVTSNNATVTVTKEFGLFIGAASPQAWIGFSPGRTVITPDNALDLEINSPIFFAGETGTNVALKNHAVFSTDFLNKGVGFPKMKGDVTAQNQAGAAWSLYGDLIKGDLYMTNGLVTQSNTLWVTGSANTNKGTLTMTLPAPLQLLGLDSLGRVTNYPAGSGISYSGGQVAASGGSGGYSLQGHTGSASSVVNSTTYFIGDIIGINYASSTTEGNLDVMIPATGTLTGYWVAVAGAGGGAENVTYTIDYDSGSNVGSQTAQWQSFPVRTSVTGLSQAVTVGHHLALKIVTPAWASVPTSTSVRWGCYITVP